MARKRRTAAEMAAARAEQHAEFERKLADFRTKHPPEACSCAETYAQGYGDPAIFSATRMKDVNSEITRAKAIGCTEYIWRTSQDSDVCPRCAANSGKVFRFDSPPPEGHPGAAPGCRCYPEPIISGDGRITKKRPRSSRWRKALWVLGGLTLLALLSRR